MKYAKTLTQIGLILVMLFASMGVRSTKAGSIQSPQTLTVTAPGAEGVVLPEIDEYATKVLGDPWDMNQPTDLWYYRDDSLLVNSQFNNGIYSAQMTTGLGGERIMLMSAGSPNHTAMRIGKIGYNYPVDADHYHWLTFRMYSSNTACNSGMVQWYSEDTYTNDVMGISNSYLVPPSPCIGQPAGWYMYTIDLKTIGLQQGQKNWSGLIRELFLHPFAGNNAAGQTVKLDFARLTTVDPRTVRPYTLRWTGDSGGGAVTLYASPNDKVLDADDIVIATGLSASGSYTYYTGVLPPGKYYIAAKNSSGISWSAGPLIIHTPPQIKITKPSMTSGEDFATTVLGDEWDMNDAADVNYGKSPDITCVTNEQFVNGLYLADIPPCPQDSSSGNPSAEPKMFLGVMNRVGTTDPVVDTSKYRYLSFRMLQAGEQNVEEGWVARFFWWHKDDATGHITEEPTTGRDIILQEGWTTYNVDLWASDAKDEAAPPGGNGPMWLDSHPNRLRFDPNELQPPLLPGSIQVDWIKLTAMDSVQRGQNFTIQYEVDKTDPVTLTYYYTPDTGSPNNWTLIEIGTNGGASGQTSSMPHKLYLPLISNNFCSDNCLNWDTTSVPVGEYYICIRAQDAYNTTVQCSEAPVAVR